MKNILLAFDKFKHTADAETVTGIVLQSFANLKKDVKLIGIPLADGGEGTSAILSKFYKCDKISLKVHNPLHKIINASYYLSHKKTALIDLASASGITTLKENERNPMKASTFGTGEMILHALTEGAEKIILACGGSATNDAGTGALSALGFHFYDKSGSKVRPNGENLIKIDSFSRPPLQTYEKVQFIILHDVHNIFHGRNGAAYVYASQKGASEKEIQHLDNGLKQFASILLKHLKKDIAMIPGTGAAGGFAGGIHAFLNAELRHGSETVLKMHHFHRLIEEADLIITGEGTFDKQSFQGKLTGTIIEKANALNLPVIVLCGRSDITPEEISFKNLQAIVALFDKKVSIEEAKMKTEKLLKQKVKEIQAMF